jgi:glucose/arabinose dehydrogenase
MFLPLRLEGIYWKKMNGRGEHMRSLGVYRLRSPLVLSLVIVCGLVVACRGVLTPTPEAEPTLEPLLTLPSQFEDRGIVTLGQPTALAFTPDGRLLITQKTGQLRVFKNGLVTSPALDISGKVCQNSEQGVLGVAVDPDFASNKFIYLFYTFKKSGSCPSGSPGNAANPVNRVSRFVLSDSNVATSETVLLDNIPSPNGNHNGGDLHFGKDRYLYVSIGDGGCDYKLDSGCAGDNDAAKDRNTLVGKIVRITNTGEIPPGNPFTGTNTARCNTGNTSSGKTCQEIFATGLRNPFRIAFNPNAPNTQFYINDVGQNIWEEINLGISGADYGWNTREGKCANGSSTNCGTPPSGLTNPIYHYQHKGCNSITGGAFVPNGYWPSEYDNAYIFSDYVCGKLFLLKGSGSNYTATEFATGLGGSSAVHLTFGPDGTGQSLYYTTFAGGGQVRVVRYMDTTNRAPVADFTASPNFGAVPLVVTFDASRSSDPDNDALTYTWNFADGTTGTGKTVQKTYNTAGKYRVLLTVKDSGGATSTKRVVVFPGNKPPTGAITAPSPTARFAVGQTITLQATGLDPEDGNLPGDRLRWTVQIRHNDHYHPYFTARGRSVTLKMPAPEDLAATETSWLEVTLVVADLQGLTTTITQKLLPRLVDVSFATSPTGRNLTVNGATFAAPKTFKSWPNYELRVAAPNQGSSVFQSWSDGGTQSHTIRTPSSNSSFTATFRTQ